MIYESDITFLLGKWGIRAEENPQSEYSKAITECIGELRGMVERVHEEEFQAYLDSMTPEEAKEYCEEQEADTLLSSLEGQEQIWC